MYVPRHLEGVYVPGHPSASPCARMNIKNEYQTGSHLDPAALHGTCCHDRPGPDTQVGADELVFGGIAEGVARAFDTYVREDTWTG